MCVCLHVCMCVMIGNRTNWTLSEFQFRLPNKYIKIPLIQSEIFSAKQDLGILLPPLTELKHWTEQQLSICPFALCWQDRGKVRSHKAAREGKMKRKPEEDKSSFFWRAGGEDRVGKMVCTVQSHTNPMDQFCYSVKKKKKLCICVEQVVKRGKVYVCACL